MSDIWVVVMAAAGFAGALAAIGGDLRPVPLAVGLGLVVVALGLRNPPCCACPSPS